MSFANPLALALLGLIPLIVILHSISLRWRSREVSSLLFWSEVLRRKRTSIRIRRILRNLSLVAEILAAAALAIALAQPRLARRGMASAGDIILVMDATASMKSREGTGTRFEEARTRALDLLAGLRRGGRMSIIAAARSPRVASPFTDDREILRRAIQSMEATDEPGNLRDSLLLAFSLRDAGRQDRVVVLSDGAFDSIGALDLSAPWIDFIPIGSSRSNVGITALQFRRTAAAVEGYEIYVGLRNFSPQPASFPLTIETARMPVVWEQITLAPGEARSLSLAWEGPTDGRVIAEIGISDDLPTDNRAYAVFEAARAVRVLLVGPESFFLQSILSAMPNVSVRRVERFDMPAESPPVVEADLVVFEGSEVPPLDTGNYILFGAVPPNIGLRVSGALSFPPVTGWNRSDPLLESVSLEGLAISQALRIEPSRGFATLALSHSSPLMLSYSQRDLKSLVFAFALESSDLALRPAFPILMANAFSWFFPSWLSVQADQVQAGTPRALLPAGNGAVTVIRPDGRRETLKATSTSPGIAATPEVGFYLVEHGGQTGEFAVSLSSAAESDIAPRFEVPAGESPPSGSEMAAAFPGSQTPIWRAIVIAAAIFIVAEWLLWLRERR